MGKHTGIWRIHVNQKEHYPNSGECGDDCQKAFLGTSSKMDHSLSPCTAWEQWHNIRQSSTTLVFNSSEMMSSKKAKANQVRSLPGGESTSATVTTTTKGGLVESPNTNQDKTSSNTAQATYDDRGCEVALRHSPLSRLRANSVESLKSVGSANSATSSSFCWQDNDASRSPSSSSVSTGTATSLSSKDADTRSQCPTPMSCDRVPDFAKSVSPDHSKDGVPNEAGEVAAQTPTNKPGRKKREEELECERLSRDLINHLPGQDNALRNILGLGPEMKTMADYMEGIFEVDIKERPITRRKSSQSSTRSSFSSLPGTDQAYNRQGSTDRTNRSSADQLPADSAYFTTSESKAKFLTRYNKDMQQHSHSTDLDDMRSGPDLATKKEELVGSITRKLEILRKEQKAIREEIGINEELGATVTGRVEQLAKSNEVDKFKLHVEEIEKITSLLLGLSGRLARAQNALMSLIDNDNSEEKKSLEAKRNKLSEQHEEAKKLKESIDKRGVQVSNFLHKYLSSEEYADFDHFIKMKAKLLMDAREIDDKIKLGEEQMLALRDNLKT